MARLPRYAASGIPQHVILRGNNRSVLFAADSDYEFFRECLRAACEKYECQVHAYVLMTNHVHLLVTPTDASRMGVVMQSVGRRYVQRFNDTYQRTGHLWEGRYRATVVESEEYLWACHCYIELNPVRAGLAGKPSGYRWSSHGANALGTSDALVTPHERYLTLAADARSRQSAYRAFFDVGLSDSTLDSIRDATKGGWALGSKRFRDEVAALLARRTQRAPKGRPRKNDENRV